MEAINTATRERFLVSTYKIPLYPGTNPPHNFIWFLGDGAITPEGTVYLLSYDSPVRPPAKDRMFKISVPGLVIPPPPVVSQFTAMPASIERGQSTTLTWSASGQVTEVSVDQAVGFVASSGSVQVAPQATTTYTLKATGPGGTATKTVTVTVTPSTAPLV